MLVSFFTSVFLTQPIKVGGAVLLVMMIDWLIHYTAFSAAKAILH